MQKTGRTAVIIPSGLGWERLAVEYRCECGYEWLEYSESSDYPNYCPHCGRPRNKDEESDAPEMREMLVPFGKRKLRIVTPVDPNHPSEVNIDIVDEHGVLIQDVVWVQPELYQPNSITVKLYGRPNDEDWSSEFTIPIKRNQE